MPGFTTARCQAILDDATLGVTSTDTIRFFGTVGASAGAASDLTSAGLAALTIGTLAAATSADPSVKANSTALESAGATAIVTVFETALARSGTVYTDQMPILPVGGATVYPFTAADTDVLTIPGHGYGTGTTGVAVLVQKLGGVGALPTGVSEHTLYYLKPSDMKLYTDSACTSVVNITAAGSGMIVQCSPKTLQVGDTIKFASGAVAFSLT